MNYELKHSTRARRITISVHHDGRVVVTVPKRVSAERALSFVQSRTPWIIQTREKLRKRFEGKTPLKQSKTEYKDLKSKALKFIQERITHYNAHYKFTFNKISIKNTSSRWGSCSRKGNLNFNYKLIDLPIEFADYIVVHELCHLKEMNHGPRFWALVAETIPNYREVRNKLRSSYIHVT